MKSVSTIVPEQKENIDKDKVYIQDIPIISQSKTKILVENKDKLKTYFHYNIIELFIVSFCRRCSWKSLKGKNILLDKAREKLFLQLDILRFLKKMQLLELMNYVILEPYENVILQFLSKPSIALAQRKDVYDKIYTVNDIASHEVSELCKAIKELVDKNKSKREERLYQITKNEMETLVKKVTHG